MREAVVGIYRLSLALADTAGARADNLNVSVTVALLSVARLSGSPLNKSTNLIKMHTTLQCRDMSL